jgi:large subunit ribosomal protein L23
MSVKPEHYDVIRKPIITEKATMASEHNGRGLRSGDRRQQAADQGSGRGAVRRQGEGGEHHRHQGQGQAFRGRKGTRKDVKKAYVTLEEGNMIDVTTGSAQPRKRPAPKD